MADTSTSITERSLRLSEERNALDYLERAHCFIKQTETDNTAWKWVVLALHGALYGFAICALKGTNQDNVVDFQRRNEVSEELDQLPANLRSGQFPQAIEVRYDPRRQRLIFKGAMSFEERRTLLGLSSNEAYRDAVNRLFEKSRRLISFGEALKRCQTLDAMRMTIMSKTLSLTNAQERSIRLLRQEFRNQFEHYMPMLWSLELHGMPEIAMDILDVIRFLALETGNYTDLNLSQERRIKSIVFQSKWILKRSRLYQETKLIENTDNPRRHDANK